MELKECKYRLPCGRCEKRGAPCDAPEECEHDWVLDETMTDVFYIINHYTCSKCGEQKTISMST